MIHNLSYNEAIKEAQKGKLIARENWLKYNEFLFFRPGMDLIYNDTRSLWSIPDAVKNWIFLNEIHINSMFKFTPYLCRMEHDHTILNGWTPNEKDKTANDWVVLDY